MTLSKLWTSTDLSCGFVAWIQHVLNIVYPRACATTCIRLRSAESFQGQVTKPPTGTNSPEIGNVTRFGCIFAKISIPVISTPVRLTASFGWRNVFTIFARWCSCWCIDCGLFWTFCGISVCNHCGVKGCSCLEGGSRCIKCLQGNCGFVWSVSDIYGWDHCGVKGCGWLGWASCGWGLGCNCFLSHCGFIQICSSFCGCDHCSLYGCGWGSTGGVLYHRGCM